MLIKNIKWASIVEAIIVMVIIVMWVVWMFELVNNSTKLSQSVKNRLEATQIAREWIEWFINIRDTNWFLYSSDYENCWNVYKYNEWCVWDWPSNWWWADSQNDTYDIKEWSYKIYRNAFDRWDLESKNTWVYGVWDYIDTYRVNLDSNWFYTQTWTLNNLLPVYTREIKVEYIDTNSDWNSNTDDQKILVTSLVQRAWSNSSKLNSLKLETVISNWKNKK